MGTICQRVEKHDVTDVIEEAESVAYRSGAEGTPSKKIRDMLDLFYANKHMYERLRRQKTGGAHAGTGSFRVPAPD